MSPIERHARKQVLLTRIAFDRVELTRELAQVRHAVRLPPLLRSLLDSSLGPALFGRTPAGGTGWLGLALSLMSRSKVASTLLGGLLPVLGLGRLGRRLATLGAIGAAGWMAWRALRPATSDPTDTPD
jgi:hypothetical protein